MDTTREAEETVVVAEVAAAAASMLRRAPGLVQSQNCLDCRTTNQDFRATHFSPEAAEMGPGPRAS